MGPVWCARRLLPRRVLDLHAVQPCRLSFGGPRVSGAPADRQKLPAELQLHLVSLSLTRRSRMTRGSSPTMRSTGPTMISGTS